MSYTAPQMPEARNNHPAPHHKSASTWLSTCLCHRDRLRPFRASRSLISFLFSCGFLPSLGLSARLASWAGSQLREVLRHDSSFPVSRFSQVKIPFPANNIRNVLILCTHSTVLVLQVALLGSYRSRRARLKRCPEAVGFFPFRRWRAYKPN
jgi:hypothetical protein